MQAVKTLEQMDHIAQRLLHRIQTATWPWVRGVPDEPHAGALTWEVPYLEIVTAEDKREASFVASQTLHYLRSSLDHLIYNASWMDTGTPQKRTQFPICDDAAKWGSRVVREQLGGLSSLHRSWVEAVQPFKGGEWTRTMQTLSNADKHRFGTEVSPTCQLKLDIANPIPSPQEPGVQLARIEQIVLRFLLPGLQPYGDVTTIFNEMVSGTAGLINKFLAEEGISAISVGAQNVVTAEGITSG